MFCTKLYIPWCWTFVLASTKTDKIFHYIMYQALRWEPLIVWEVLSLTYTKGFLGKSISKNKNNEIALLNYVDGKDICIVL